MRFSLFFLFVAISHLNGMHARSSVSATAPIAAAAAAATNTRDILIDAATASATRVSQSDDLSCGISSAKVNERIIGGKEAEPHTWPWQAFVYCSKGKGEDGFACGGSLVSDKWVITAAHCLFLRNTTTQFNTNECVVYLGKHLFLNPYEKEPTEVIFHLESYFIHEQYNNIGLNFTKGYDIAVLKLDKAVQFNNNIKPICLPCGLPELQNTSICYATGWGRDDRSKDILAKALKQLQMPILNANAGCLYPGIAAGPQICAGFRDRGDDVCLGDSGGPLACREDGRWYLRGVTSFVPDGCYSWATFTKVTGFQDWINKTISCD